MHLGDIEEVKFTSGGKGTFDGQGKEWWGAIKYLRFGEDRPRLLSIDGSKNIIAFNTDGFDVTGNNVHIHDCNIWNQDDCIAVKGCATGSTNMLFERISCSGLGLVIGSIGSSVVRNITFRDSVMPSTYKGIYMKTRWSDLGPNATAAVIEDILYQNITMEAPQQYAIWIGPAQQTAGGSCDLLWPSADKAECRMSGYQTWRNIVLRDIYINNPVGSPGLIFGNSSNPMTGILFDNVVVTNPGEKPFGPEYYCEGISHGLAKGGTSPVPVCFRHKEEEHRERARRRMEEREGGRRDRGGYRGLEDSFGGEDDKDTADLPVVEVAPKIQQLDSAKFNEDQKAEIENDLEDYMKAEVKVARNRQKMSNDYNKARDINDKTKRREYLDSLKEKKDDRRIHDKAARDVAREKYLAIKSKIENILNHTEL
eukprot:gene22512-28641_t